MRDIGHRFFLAPLIAFLLTFDSFGAPPQRPNIVLIMTDDQGWWDLGSHGNPVLQTPHMDQLAKDGVEFTRFYVSPVCSLTRASLLTGRYPLRTGCFDTRNGHDTVAADEVTIANTLKSAGYSTGIFGKWHVGRYMPYHPNNRGFDEFFGFWQYGHVERYFHPDRMWHNQERVACRGHITELITSAAIDFINSADKPFFCYVAYNVPHEPLQAPDALVEKYRSRNVPQRDAQIYALVEQCDTEIGRLLQTIERSNLRDNTVVLFLSDNGGISRYYKAGLHGNKGTVFEGGIRAPFFVRYPGHFSPGRKIAAPADAIDILPTVAEFGGAKLPANKTIDGVSLVPWLENDKLSKAPHDYLYHMWSRDLPRNDENWAIQDTRYKLANGKLFDLSVDGGEKTDVAAAKPDITHRLRQKYEKWFNDVTAGRKYERVHIEIGREDENPVELQMSWADLHGPATRYTFDAYDWDFVDGWRENDDAVSWQTTVVAPGRYEVSITYGCARTDAGGEFRVRAGNAHVDGKVEATPTPDVFITRTLGIMRLPAGDTEVRIETKRAPGRQLMALNRLCLRRLN